MSRSPDNMPEVITILKCKIEFTPNVVQIHLKMNGVIASCGTGRA
jgi:hypothetical protein